MESWQEEFAWTALRRSADTAHDLKTPLNVAVLNLELLRMRMRKLAGADDPKLLEYARSLETELRRLAGIFDVFFVYVVPPSADAPTPVKIDGIVTEEAVRRGIDHPPELVDVAITGHETRIREMVRLLFDGVFRLFREGTPSIGRSSSSGRYLLRIQGLPTDEEVQLEKMFKLYYTDSEGNPDLALAAARLIAETYGGTLSASEQSGRAVLELSLPLGER